MGSFQINILYIIHTCCIVSPSESNYIVSYYMYHMFYKEHFAIFMAWNLALSVFRIDFDKILQRFRTLNIKIISSSRWIFSIQETPTLTSSADTEPTQSNRSRTWSPRPSVNYDLAFLKSGHTLSLRKRINFFSVVHPQKRHRFPRHRQCLPPARRRNTVGKMINFYRNRRDPFCIARSQKKRHSIN